MMCTRFVFRGEDVLTGFNFDIDLKMWDHRLLFDGQRFYIGILQPDGKRHGYHGVNANGNVGTLLYVHGNAAGVYCEDMNCMTIAELTEAFISGRFSYEEVRALLERKMVLYAPDATMQAMLSDVRGRTLIIEPGIGWREECNTPFSLITNYSVIAPKSTAPYVVPGDDRYERAREMLEQYDVAFGVKDAFQVLSAVQQEEPWATRVSFVYSVQKQTVYYCENRDFVNVKKVVFSNGCS